MLPVSEAFTHQDSARISGLHLHPNHTTNPSKLPRFHCLTRKSGFHSLHQKWSLSYFEQSRLTDRRMSGCIRAGSIPTEWPSLGLCVPTYLDHVLSSFTDLHQSFPNTLSSRIARRQMLLRNSVKNCFLCYRSNYNNFISGNYVILCCGLRILTNNTANW
jgi:hypothetical protein